LLLLCLSSAQALSGPDSEAERQQTPATGAQRTAGESPPDEASVSWLETSHTYASDQVQALTVWMDRFFGDPDYDLEKAESLVRIRWNHELDETDDYNGKLRVRGKLRMPRISKRLNLVFSGEDGDALTADEQRDESDVVGVQYTLRELNRSRLDTTIAWAGGDLRPGIRYRNQGPIGEHSGYRYTQRLEYERDEGFFTTGDINLDRAINDSTLVRWRNRARYGEETKGTEWRTQLVLGDRRKPEDKLRGQTVIAYYAAINGYTDPSYIRNYSLGVVFRRQLHKRILFAELEPSYNWRQDGDGQERYGAWNIVFRLELLLESENDR
jgi:hypothetical protein